MESKRPDIVFSAPVWERLYAHLIRSPSGHGSVPEEFAYLFVTLNASTLGLRFLVHDFLPAQPSDFVSRSPVGYTLKTTFALQALNTCSREGWSLFEAHSHPFDSGTNTTFSGVDWQNYRQSLLPFATLLGEPYRCGALVVGQRAVDAHYYEPQARAFIPLERLTIVGAYQGSQLTYIPTTSGRRQNPFFHDERFQSQEIFFKEKETQATLLEATVAIVGISGLGSFVATELAHLGVGRLILVDHDRVEERNLNRIVGASAADVGKEKVQVFARRLQEIAPSLEVIPIAQTLLSEETVNVVKGADLLVGCVDNDGARMVLNLVATRYCIPYIDGRTGIHPPNESHKRLIVNGEVQLVLPGLKCLLCSGRINIEEATLTTKSPHEQAIDQALGYGVAGHAPAVISLNGVIASLQVTEVLSLLSGSAFRKHTPALSYYDALLREVSPVTIGSPPEDCDACGIYGFARYGDVAPINFATDIDDIPVVLKEIQSSTQ